MGPQRAHHGFQTASLTDAWNVRRACVRSTPAAGARRLAAISDFARRGCYKRRTNAGFPDPRPARGEGRAGGDRSRGAEAACAARRAAPARGARRADRAARRRALRRASRRRPRRRRSRTRSSRSARCSEPDVLVTRRARATCSQVARDQVDAHRFEQLLADARRASPAERRALLVRALELWRGPALAEFAFEEWAQAETRRLDELRLVAVEERIAADVELGHPADVVARAGGARPASILCASALVSPHAGAPRGRGVGRGAAGLHRCAGRARRARHRAGRGAPAAPGRDPPRRGQGCPLERARRPRRGRRGREGARLGARRPGARARRWQPILPSSSRSRSAIRATSRWTSHASRSTSRR